MTETNDYTPQLNKSIEWAKQTRYCEVCRARTPHKRVVDSAKYLRGLPERWVYLCGWCGTTEETK